MRILALFLSCLAVAAAQTAPDFHIKDGERIVFYGDSITDQRLYTTFVETFILTRFPERKITFVHSGWGGDRVSGGGGGSADTRIARDIVPYKPNHVTIMLGMNDGRYRPYEQDIYDTYAAGFDALVKQIKAGVPGVHITAIRPSPYDEVTRAPMTGGSYNQVLVEFGNYLTELAKRENLGVADLNAPVVAMLQRAYRRDAATAERIIPDRVHPGPAGHLIMAGALLKAWKAQPRVTFVEIDAAGGQVKEAARTKLTDLKPGPALSWSQLDQSLPMPVEWDDPVVKLAVESSDFSDSLNRQNLKITGLSGDYYALLIDGQQIRVWSAKDFNRGVNLALYPTPMAKQAAAVHRLTLQHNTIHFARWRSLQVPLATDNLAKLNASMASLDALEEEIVAKQRAAAVPAAHKYELVPATKEMSNIPPGFTPIFDGKDLNGWHISQVNHHGNTKSWVVQNGVLTGAQDRPGHGGILLTDKKYKNFEVYMEINPDFGCDSGLFLRSNEKGQAYQVMLDYLEGGNMGGVYGEALQGVRGYMADFKEKGNWQDGQWNSIRARIEGDTPRIRVWMNGVQITDWTDTSNHLIDGATDGMIAVQVHMGDRWKAGGQHRFRNIAVRELP
jgi:lysophospholipase L1-like esterase